MNFFLKFGNFSKFYLLILYSFLTKLLINALFRLDYQHTSEKTINNCSIVKYPVLNNYVLVYFIYYYFGYLLFSFIFLAKKYKKEKNKIDYNKNIDNSLEINGSSTSELKTQNSINNNSKFLSFFFPNISKEKLKESLKIFILVSFIYMVGEMIIGYLDQKNHTYVNFCMFQIIFIHFFLFKLKKYKLYKHQILSFFIILILGFGIKLISSLTRQCEYNVQDPNKEFDESKYNFIKNETLKEELIEKLKNLKDIIIRSNEAGVKSCKNAYNIFFVNTGDFYGFIIIAILGYLIGNILHSFCTVNIRELINTKYISHYSFIFLIGFFGIIISIFSLTVSTLVSCGKFSDNKRISFLCPVTKNIYENTTMPSEHYFDNLIAYKVKFHDVFVQKHKQKGEKGKKPKDGVIEIIFTVLLPLLTFSKANFDFLIIKELGPFHILFPEILFQISKDFIIFIYKATKHLLDNTQIKQLIIVTSANIITFIGLCIYLELIELHFCGFDKDIKKNIALRGLNDMEANEGLVDNEICFGDDRYGISERDSYTNVNNK